MVLTTQEEQKSSKSVGSVSKAKLDQGSDTSIRLASRKSKSVRPSESCLDLLDLPSSGRATFSAMPKRSLVSRQHFPPRYRCPTEVNSIDSGIWKPTGLATPHPALPLYQLGDLKLHEGFPDDFFVGHSAKFSIRIQPKRSGPRARQKMYQALWLKEQQRKRVEAACLSAQSGLPVWENMEHNTHWSLCDMSSGVPYAGGGDEEMIRSPTYIEWCERRSTWRQDMLDYWQLLRSECHISHGRMQQSLEFYPRRRFSLDNLKRITQALIHFDAALPHSSHLGNSGPTIRHHSSAARPLRNWWKYNDSLKDRTRSQAMTIIEEQKTSNDLERVLMDNDDRRRVLPVLLEWIVDPLQDKNQPTNQQAGGDGIDTSEHQKTVDQARVIYYNIPPCTNGVQAVASLELPLALVKAAYLCPSKTKLESYAPNALGLREFLGHKRSPVGISTRMGSRR